MTDSTDPVFLERIYEALATAIDRCRAEGDPGPAADREAQLLAQISLIALNRIGDADVALSIIDRAERAVRSDHASRA